MFSKSLKADFYRLKKDNLLWISVIVVTGFSVFTFLIYLLIHNLATADGLMMPPIITTLAGLRLAMNMTNNAGLIVLIMTIVLMAKDFRQSTIRNKTIIGIKRREAYFSSLIVYYLFVLGIMTYNVILTVLLFSTTFESGVSEGSVILEFLKNYAIGVAILTPWVIIAHFLTYVTKSLGLALGLTIGLFFLLQIVALIPQIVEVSETTGLLMHFNPVLQTMSYNMGGFFEEKKYLWFSLGSNAVIPGLLIFIGSFLFSKADIK